MKPGHSGHLRSHAGFVAIVCLFLLLFSYGGQLQSAELTVEVHYIEKKIEHPPVLSNLVAWPEDDGLQGTLLGISDNNTTGKFLNQEYVLVRNIVDSEADVVSEARSILAKPGVIAILNVSAKDLLSIADLPEADDDLLFNARSMKTTLRNEQCRKNILHSMASRAMLSDALMQFFSKRRWQNLFLIEGRGENDGEFAKAIAHSATKFGLKIRERKKWIENADIRRTAASEIPAFTQAKKYDVVVVTDENRDFAQYLLYNTWLARPVAGSAGLTPVVWSHVIEQWGAAQLQSRFKKQSKRHMTSVDYANWVAVRSIGEAVTRTSSNAAASIREYILSDKFAIAAFKGKKMSFRDWNGQLRQPIALAHPTAVVANAPLEGFLHQKSELDTLGLDKQESKCEQFE